MQLCGLKKGTQGVYLAAVKGLAVYYNERPDHISNEEVQEYLLYLIEDQGLSHSTTNCAVAAFRLFHRKVLGGSEVKFWIPRRREAQKLPDVLSFDELARLFAAATRPKDRALLMTTYAAGLRVSEVVALQVGDIDGGRMVIHVRQGKGNKDRYTVLSERLLSKLRAYWRIERPPVYLCAGESGRDFA